MEVMIGIGVLILLPLVFYARQQMDAAAQARRRGAGDDSGVDVIIDPSGCDGGDGGGGDGGGCGGCGS